MRFPLPFITKRNIHRDWPIQQLRSDLAQPTASKPGDIVGLALDLKSRQLVADSGFDSVVLRDEAGLFRVMNYREILEHRSDIAPRVAHLIAAAQCDRKIFGSIRYFFQNTLDLPQTIHDHNRITTTLMVGCGWEAAFCGQSAIENLRPGREDEVVTQSMLGVCVGNLDSAHSKIEMATKLKEPAMVLNGLLASLLAKSEHVLEIEVVVDIDKNPRPW